MTQAILGSLRAFERRLQHVPAIAVCAGRETCLLAAAAANHKAIAAFPTPSSLFFASSSSTASEATALRFPSCCTLAAGGCRPCLTRLSYSGASVLVRALQQMTTKNAEAVVCEACRLPRLESENGVYVHLPPPPKNSTFVLPRMHPWPSRRLTETRWEAFARAKGITKRRRSRLVWSDVARDWVPRWGARSAHAREEAAHASVGVVEGTSTYLGRVGHARGIKKLGKRVKKELRKAGSKQAASGPASSRTARKQGGVELNPDGPQMDPFASRKLRSAKQKLRELRSQLEAQAKGKRLPAGVLPVIGRSGGSNGGTSSKRNPSALKKHRGQTREELKEVLGRAQLSTASCGTHDRLVKNEKKEQKASCKGKSTSFTEERGAYLKQLKQVLHKASSTV